MFIDARAGKHAEDAGWARGAGRKASPPASLCTAVRHGDPAAQSITTQALTFPQTRRAEGCCETNTRTVRFSRDAAWKGMCEPATTRGFREDLKAGRSRMMESMWSFPTQWEGRRMEIKMDCTGFLVYWEDHEVQVVREASSAFAVSRLSSLGITAGSGTWPLQHH